MTLIVLTVLATAWLGYFALWYRERRTAQPMRTDGIVGLNRSLNSMGRGAALPGGAALPVGVGGGAKPRGELFEAPRTPQQALSRRRQVAAVLIAAAAVSLLAVPVLGAASLAGHVLADLALLLFAFGAVRRQQPAVPAMAEVRMLYPQGLARGDAVVTPLRRVVNG